jgi:hypothetical protein
MPVGLRRHGADQRECPPGSEARCRSGLTGPWCEPRIPKTCSPATNRTLIYGMGFYTPLWWMCCPCMPCRRNGRILLANLLQCSKSTFFSGKFPQLFCLQRRYVEHTNFATWGFANSIRPLFAHDMRGAMLPVQRARKLSPSINVKLVVGLEVFRQHADRIASQPSLAGALTVTTLAYSE